MAAVPYIEALGELRAVEHQHVDVPKPQRFAPKNCKKYSQIAFKADDKFVPSSPLGLQWLPKSLDAMKICPKKSKVIILEPKGYQNGSQTTRIAKNFLQKMMLENL